MRCFAHADVDAEALCHGCNKALCGRCSTRFGINVCESCVLSRNRAVAREMYTGLLTTLITFGGATWFFMTLRDSAGLPTVTPTTAAFLGMLFAFTYWGWKFLSNYFPTLWFGTGIIWLIYVVLKFIASYFIGLIVGPFQIIRMLNQLRIVSRVKRQIASGKL